MDREVMNCKVFQNEIEEAPDPRVLDKNVLAHIASCTGCQWVLRDRIGLDLLLKDLPAVDACSDFDWRLRARLDGRRATTPGFYASWFSGLGTVRLSGAAALLFLVLAGVIGYGIRWRPNQPTEVVAKAEAMPIEKAMAYAHLLRDVAIRGNASTEAVETGSTQISRVIKKHDALAKEPKTSLAKHQRREIRRTEGLRTVDLAVRPPTVLFGNRANESNFIDVADASGRFSVPDRDLRVKLAEGRGQMRTVSLKSVTFGSQQMLEHGGRVISSSSSQGIW
jgi:hypothetical protein